MHSRGGSTAELVDLGDLAERVRALGRALGFDAVGFAPAEPPPHAHFLPDWLERGYAGQMSWLLRRAAERGDPRRLFPGAQTVIAVALVYDNGEAAMRTPGSRAQGRVSRYAGGEDYHAVLGDRLRALEAGLAPLADEPVSSRSYVDTGPVLERAHAARAGLGWVGKNTCLIHPGLGSFLFLGVVLTDLRLPADEAQTDHCGRCRACLDACPTQAFPEPYVLDASRCLSYTTIELRESIPAALREAQGSWVFGCDVCQDVCPWNTRSGRRVPPDPLGLRLRLAPREDALRPALERILQLDEVTWRALTRRSPLRRTRFRGLLRNALVAAGNSGDRSLVASVQRHAEGADTLLAEHARWALQKLAGGADPAA